MTSEVVVMNRLGIALATDSAATVKIDNGRVKLFHADKLFMLSKRHPVGVMTYNNSSLLGVPWEVVVKMYRQKLDLHKFDTLEEYAQDFISYLGNNSQLFPVELQNGHYLELVKSFFEGIRDRIDRINFEHYRYTGKDDSAANNQVAKRIILETLGTWNEKEVVSCFEPSIGADMSGQFSGQIHKLVQDNFATWQIDAEAQTALRQLASYIISKDEILPASLSGVVIAGFGAKQHFPVMVAYELGEIYSGRIKYKHVETERIDSDNPSVVKPFADTEMVDTFLNGISPILKRRLQKAITGLMLGVSDVVIDGLSGISRKRKNAYKEKSRPIIEDVVISSILARFEKYKDEHALPVEQAIAFLPKNELAHVAASLVNLNIFQKRMSTNEDETVGGPIDVAVISKGDGFVWIARKHYFPRELNHHFYRNYSITDANREGDVNGEKEEDIGHDKTE